MIMQALLKTLAAACVLACAGAASASVVLFDSGLYTAAPNGVENDPGVIVLPTDLPYSQSFTAPAGILESIVWWGYRLNEFSSNPPPASDDFTVTLGSAVQSGNLSKSVAATFGNVALIRYELDVLDVALVPGAQTLTVQSNSALFDWYWQGVDAADPTVPTSGFRAAFNLLGTAPVINTNPEPGSLALVALAGLALLATRRSRPA